MEEIGLYEQAKGKKLLIIGGETNIANIVNEAKKLILGNDFIPCTGCRYCMPCPLGVNIPKIFALFNNYGIHRDLNRFKEQMAKLTEEHPKNCVKCGKCVKQCPQHIVIYEQLEKIAKIISE